jgi:DNA-binding NarL/FixJ family response regulator
MGKLFAQRERDLETKIRQTHSDLKRVEMQMRSPDRETPESVELAIQLVRQGERNDQIARKTGLSADIIETISALHAQRARH